MDGAPTGPTDSPADGPPATPSGTPGGRLSNPGSDPACGSQDSAAGAAGAGVSGGSPPTIEDRVAAQIPPTDRGAGVTGLLADMSRVDHEIYRAVARTETPSMDVALRRLSGFANHSVLWLTIAGGLAVGGGPTGRRAALHGAVSVGLTSALVNLGMKSLGRSRPDRAGAEVPEIRHVRMPESSSFPSGHSASGFAFAEAVGIDVPTLALPLRALAATVAYSRVHTGVHYPGDAIAGALIGSATGLLVSSWMPSW